jgi:hypothetical protein
MMSEDSACDGYFIKETPSDQNEIVTFKNLGLLPSHASESTPDDRSSSVHQ